MKIERFLYGAVAGDGGTIVCRAELSDDTVLDLGLDARIPKKKSERQVFIGAGYPTAPGARILTQGSQEEQNVINAIQEYLDRTCRFLRREALFEANPSTSTTNDDADRMVIALMEAILDR